MPPPADGMAAASTTCRVREVLTSHRKISAEIHHRIKCQTLFDGGGTQSAQRRVGGGAAGKERGEWCCQWQQQAKVQELMGDIQSWIYINQENQTKGCVCLFLVWVIADFRFHGPTCEWFSCWSAVRNQSQLLIRFSCPVHSSPLI